MAKNDFCEEFPSIRVKVDRLFHRENSRLRAIASVTIGGAFAVHGVRILDSPKGLFVSMPSISYKDKGGQTRYQDIFHPVTAGARTELSSAILEAYDVAEAEELERSEPVGGMVPGR